MAAYGAAGISFLSSLVRDYAVINFSNQDKLFFQLLYIASMAAGFGVNAIALGSGALGKAALATLCALGIIVIVVMLPMAETAPVTIALLVSILLLWIVGAQWSRTLMERGWVFCGRVREAVASMALAALVVLGLGIEPAFLSSVAAGTMFSWAMWRLTSAPGHGPSVRVSSAVQIVNLTRSIVLTNVATFSITYWALVQSGMPGEVFGYAISTTVRFAMYFFQILTIGSVALVSVKGLKTRRNHIRWLILVGGTCFVLSLLLPLPAALFFVPLFAALTHYGVVIFLQQIPGTRV